MSVVPDKINKYPTLSNSVEECVIFSRELIERVKAARTNVNPIVCQIKSVPSFVLVSKAALRLIAKNKKMISENVNTRYDLAKRSNNAEIFNAKHLI